MGPRIRRVTVDASSEQDLITGLIISTQFCRRVLPMLRPEHLKSTGSHHILRWIQDYYARYEKSCGKDIQAIFNVERPSLPEAEASVISSLLAALSERLGENTNQNWEYQADLARDYIRTRSLEVLAETVKVLKDRGDLSKAEKSVRDFVITRDKTSEWVSPLTDIALQREVLDRDEEGGKFKLDGALGELFGPWHLGWLVAFFGATKRYKTWMMMETAMQAVSLYGLKVAFISMEMTKIDMEKRWMHMASFLPEDRGPVQVPVWDCLKNQDDDCTLKARTNHEPIPRGPGNLPKFDEASNYRPCTYCKNNHEYLKYYRVTSWFTIKYKKQDFRSGAIEAVRNFASQYRGGNLKMICHPRGSVGVEDIGDDLDELESMGFIPQMVVVDYADILRDDRGKNDEWLRLDSIWQKLSGLAAERSVMLVTGSQVDVKGTDARTLRATHGAGFKGKSNHIDLGIGLNQLDRALDGRPSEKSMMIMRLNITAKRHGRWSDDQAFLLQNLDMGQPAMDSFAISVGHKLIAAEER